MNDPRLTALKAAITARGWRWRPGKEIPFGTQLLVEDGASQATLDFYPKRGRTVVGGAASPLRRELEALAAAGEPATPRPAARPSAQRSDAAPPLAASAEIGMDESGKGDWFGPLVVAAVAVEPSIAAALLKAGARDSKALDADELVRATAAIEQVVPEASREVLVLDPERYNERYAALGNINLLLAELYAEAAAPVVERTGIAVVVCDQFSQRTDRLDRAFSRAGLPHPRQLHHAEDASLAVAAASVLATARFHAELARLGGVAGLGGPLPRGATAVHLLRRAARAIIAREGRDALGRYAKLNFKPVQELLAGEA